MRKYRADYRTARADEAGYGAPRRRRRPPSEGSDCPDKAHLLSEPESILKKEKDPTKCERDPWSRLERVDSELQMHYQRPGASQTTYFTNASCPTEDLYTYPKPRSTLPRVSVTAPSTPTARRVLSPLPGVLTRNVSFAALPNTSGSTTSLTSTLPVAMTPLYPTLAQKNGTSPKE